MDLWTVATSIGGSLLVSWIGVRYFTGQRIRAEREVVALDAIESAVLPLLRDARSFASRPHKPRREPGVTHVDDGVQALQVLDAARHLSWWRRALVERHCRRLFGDAWVRHAMPEVGSTDAEIAGRIFVRRLFETNDASGVDTWPSRPVVDRSDGLIQRTYEGAADPAQLVRELTRLSRGR